MIDSRLTLRKMFIFPAEIWVEINLLWVPMGNGQTLRHRISYERAHEDSQKKFFRGSLPVGNVDLASE